MNNPFDYTPDAACEEAFAELIVRLDALKGSVKPDDVKFCRELDEGKMLGILIAADQFGERHKLYAFSGQLGDGGFYHAGFVEPVFDYLEPDGYYKRKEREICRQNVEIELFEETKFVEIKKDYEREKDRSDAEVAQYKEKCRQTKLERAARRESGRADEAEMAEMIRQSQFEKAELRRLKKRLEARLEPYAAELRRAQAHLNALKKKRHDDSEALQQWLFSNFRLLNARGESRSVGELFAETPLRIPPSGAGECCAPKLLQAAYRKGWKPLAIAEYWYGKPKGGEVRKHGDHYPACRGKCLPLLTWMLQGVDVEPPLGSESWVKKGDIASGRESWPKTAGPESGGGGNQEPKILFENDKFCIVDKPGGMLSVPGKGMGRSVQQWLQERYGDDCDVKVAHRLDQDTSGLLVATFGELSYKVMQKLFASRRVRKTYVAELEGDYDASGVPGKGRIELPLSPDWLDRPRQRVDKDCGKDAVTEYEFIGKRAGHSRVIFHPLTGRTHQLRVHAASEMGLGMPIAGDRLYGKNMGDGAERLLLHAHRLEFTFPTDGQYYCFESPVPF